MPSLQLSKSELLPDLDHLTTTRTNGSTEPLITLELQGRTSLDPDQPVPKSAQPGLLTTPAAASKRCDPQIDNPDTIQSATRFGPKFRATGKENQRSRIYRTQLAHSHRWRSRDDAGKSLFLSEHLTPLTADEKGKFVSK